MIVVSSAGGTSTTADRAAALVAMVVWFYCELPIQLLYTVAVVISFVFLMRTYYLPQNGDSRSLGDVKPRVADDSLDKSKIWKLTEISEPTQCRSLRLPENLRASKVGSAPILLFAYGLVITTNFTILYLNIKSYGEG